MWLTFLNISLCILTATPSENKIAMWPICCAASRWYEQHAEEAQFFINVPIHVLIQLLFKRHAEAEVKHPVTVSIKKTQTHPHKNAIHSILVVQTPQYNEWIQAQWSTGKHRAVCKCSFDREGFFFCIYAVSNLSSEVCLQHVKHATKPCSRGRDLDPSSFSCCALTTKLQKRFPFVWIWVVTVTINIIYYSKWHRVVSIQHTRIYPSPAKGKGLGCCFKKSAWESPLK